MTENVLNSEAIASTALNHFDIFAYIYELMNYFLYEQVEVQEFSPRHKKHPKVKIETRAQIWYKQVALYVVWGWISIACPAAGFWALIVNDGGVFYNECYYMFYNGVVWYNPPTPYVIQPNLNNGLLLGDGTTAPATGTTTTGGGLFGGSD